MADEKLRAQLQEALSRSNKLQSEVAALTAKNGKL